MTYPYPPGGHEATDTRLAYTPVSQAHGHNHIVQCFSLLLRQSPKLIRSLRLL